MHQLDAVKVKHRLLYVLDELLDIAGCRSITIDDEIGVLGRYLCATDAVPLEPRRGFGSP